MGVECAGMPRATVDLSDVAQPASAHVSQALQRQALSAQAGS